MDRSRPCHVVYNRCGYCAACKSTPHLVHQRTTADQDASRFDRSRGCGPYNRCGYCAYCKATR